MKKLRISKENLISNINKIKSHTSSKIIATLKNNGYGLGLNEFPKILLENGIDFFAVSTIDEALTLRKNGFINQIMLLHSTFLEEDLKALIDNNIIITIGSFDALDKVLKIPNDKIDVQIKIDSGFGRFGFLPSEIDKLIKALKSTKKLNIIGTFSHFTMSFGKNRKYTDYQFNTFMQVVNKLKENKINTGMLHICNSSAFLRYKELHLDAVRVGSAFLGRILVENNLELQKVGQLISKIEDIKTLPDKHFIGYSNTYKTNTPSKIGIIPVGYLDGFGLKKAPDCFRANDILRDLLATLKTFNKKTFVKIDNKNVPILGKIGTNNIIVKLTDSIDVDSEVVAEINPMLIRPDIKREFI